MEVNGLLIAVSIFKKKTANQDKIKKIQSGIFKVNISCCLRNNIRVNFSYYILNYPFLLNAVVSNIFYAINAMPFRLGKVIYL